MARAEDDKNFAFAVEALGSLWSVYRFVKDGKRGMMAFTKHADTGKWTVGMIKPGELTPEEVIDSLVKNAPS